MVVAAGQGVWANLCWRVSNGDAGAPSAAPMAPRRHRHGGRRVGGGAGSGTRVDGVARRRALVHLHGRQAGLLPCALGRGAARRGRVGRRGASSAALAAPGASGWQRICVVCWCAGC